MLLKRRYGAECWCDCHKQLAQAQTRGPSQNWCITCLGLLLIVCVLFVSIGDTGQPCNSAGAGEPLEALVAELKVFPAMFIQCRVSQAWP